jgi:hypothetical protein
MRISGRTTLAPTGALARAGTAGCGGDGADPGGVKITGFKPEFSVADGEGEYLGPDVALAALQDILQTTPEFEVVVGSDLLTTVPNEGLITKDNVDQFEPEWVG